MNSHDFDNIIKQKAQQRETDVPADIWGNITAKKKRRKYPFFWLILLVLILAGSSIIWNTNNKKMPVSLAAIETKDNDENVSINKELNEKNNSPVSPGNENKKTMVSGPGENSQSTINSNDSLSDIAVNNKTSAKTNFTSASTNKKRISDLRLTYNPVNKILTSKKEIAGKTITGTESIITPVGRKKNLKGNSKINIVNHGMEEPANTATKENDNTDQLSATVAGEASVNISAPVATGTTDENITAIVKQIMPVENKDSLFAGKRSQHTKDSSVKKTAVSSTGKKEQTGQKKQGLKIEVGLTAILPLQQYKKPVSIKRLANTPDVNSEFISENIKSKVETGAGFSMNVLKSLGKKWGMGTGINYSRFTESLQVQGTETHTNYTIVQRLDTNANGAYLKVDTVRTITKNNTTLTGRNIYTTISIPLLVRYQIITKKKWSFSLTTGVYVDLVRKYHNNIPGELVISNANGKISESSTNTGFNLFTGLHFSGMLYRRYEWFAASSFSFDLSGYKTNSLSFNKKIHTPGISFGIAYRLR